MTAKGNDDLTWDLNGRMIAGVTSSLTYNHDGKLQSGSAAGVTVDLKYDPDGNRIYREVTSGPTTTKRKYVIDTEGDLPVVLLEINPDISDPNSCIVKTYLYAGTDTIAQHDGFYADDKYFYLSDRIGSVRQVIDVNASVEHLYSYGPFGTRLEADADPDPVSNRLGFTGQYFDEELNQYYLRARQYILALYRFSTRDPYTGSSNEPLELHRYLYCQNDPVNAVDPSGEFLGLGISAKMRATSAAFGTKAMALAGQVYVQAMGTACAMHYTTWKFMTTGTLDTSFFRGPEHGAWKHGGVWQSGWHFHLPWGPGMGTHHLPQEFLDWWKNFMSVYFKK
jgi:RHS repeat-associated protein